VTGISSNALIEATEIANRQSIASGRLRNALVNGRETAGIRKELADLEAQATQLAASQARQADAEEARLAEQIEAGAKVLEADARTRVASLMAALEIPPAPISVESAR
jgi:hypothetical protein